jgi:shikimate 5-dehydrogenase
LKKEGADVTIFARDRTKAEFLSKNFSVKYQELSPRGFAGYDMLVNATPLGMRGSRQNETILTAEQLRGVRLAYDLVYNPSETRFISEANAAGCETIGGLEMLIAQAVEQFKLWTGKSPNVDVMRATATRRLGID